MTRDAIQLLDARTYASAFALEGFDCPPWMRRGICAQTDPEAWFPEKGGSTPAKARQATQGDRSRMKPRQSIRIVPLSRIDTNPANIREDLGDVTELACSIREHGILQPLVVTDDYGDRFLLLGGHRRAAAARAAGLTEVPIVIRHGLATDDVEQLVVMLVENCQRADLNPIEKAEALGQLREQGMAQGDIARRTGLSQASVSRLLALLKLPLSERQAIKAGHRSANQVLGNAREQRQQERVRAAGRPVGRPKGRKTTPHFSPAHPLAAPAAKLCDHRGVPKVGQVACGPCWETAIREDALNGNVREQAS